MRRGLVAMALLSLAACGGGGSGGSATPTPSPVPTPSPTPTPAPTASPTATARIVALSASPGRLDFYAAIPGDLLTQGFTDRNGFYFPGYADAVSGYRGSAAGGDASADNAGRFKWASVRDRETQIVVSLFAPADARVVSPVTSLLTSGTLTQATLKAQLGIAGSLFALTVDPDLRTYDPLAELQSGDAGRAADGARLLSAHVRVMAIAFGGFEGISARAAPLAPGIASSWLNPGWNAVSGCLAAAPARFVFTNTEMAPVLRCGGAASRATLDDATYSAIAHLVDAYAAAVPVRLEDGQAVARWVLGIKGYLAPTIALLASDPSPTALSTALAVTTQTILDETARYADHLDTPAEGSFFAGPDFVATRVNASVTVPGATLRQNDLRYQATDGGLVVDGTIQSVAVPAANASQVQAQLVNGDVILIPAAGFRGATFVDYVIRASDGTQRTARIYLRVL